MESLLDAYERVDVIASGGMGTVIKAKCRSTDRSRGNPPWITLTAFTFKPAHSKEAHDLLSALVDRNQQLSHPNIARTLGVSHDASGSYVMSEYLQGESLGHRLRFAGAKAISRTEIMKVIDAVGRALKYAHQHRVVHGDIKPANIFLTREGNVKILNFGVKNTIRSMAARLMDPPSVEMGSFSSLTVDYASPEQLAAGKPDPRDDLYGLACISYELLSGHHPFDRMRASSAQRAGRTVQPRPGLNARQLAVLARALAFERKARHNSVGAFVAEFQRASRTWAMPMPGFGVSALKIAVALGLVGIISLGGLRLMFSGERQESLSASEPTSTTETLEIAEVSTEMARSLAAITPSAAAAPAEKGPAESGALSRQTDALVQELETLLVRADRQLQRQRLSSPQGDNALESYREVLRREPGNPTALAGIAEITSKYTLWAKTAVQKQDWLAAKINLEKAAAIEPGDILVQETLAQVKLAIHLENQNKVELPRPAL